MKSKLLFLLSLTIGTCYGQSVSIENLKEKTLYVGFYNNFSFTCDIYPCYDLSVSCNNGSVAIDSCYLQIIPEKEGDLELTFYHKKGNDSLFVSKKIYRVIKMPNPEPRMYLHSRTSLSKKAIIRGRIEIENTQYYRAGCEIYFPLKSFKILVTRKNNLVGYSYNEGDQYTEQSLELLKKLKVGDEVIFTDIIGMNYYKEMVRLSDLKFEVK